MKRPGARIARAKRPALAASAAGAVLLACQFQIAFAFDAAKCEKDDMPDEDVRACTEAIYAQGTTTSDRIRIYTLRGIAWMREDEPLAAISDFTRAIDLRPHDVAALKGRASAYAKVGQHDLAAKDWSAIIALSPQHSDYFNQRGTVYLAAGLFDDALADFTRAAQLEPRNPAAHVGRARVYERLDNREMAIKEFELAVAAAPALWTTYLARAEVADRWGDREMAIANYRLVIKHNHRHWNSYKALHRLGADSYFGQEK